ncbi:MAG: universal stress protein, partial [Desulfosarcina sp.]
SRSCECAIRFASRLARSLHSRLSIFHMLPVPPVPKYTRSDYTADATRARKRLESFYEGYLKDSDHDYLLRPGAVPALEIRHAAIDRHADLIVMGSHTKDASGKWYPGSAVERVSHMADCPVIVITDPGVLMHWNGVAAGDDGQNKDRSIHLFTKTSTYHLNKLREILVVGVSKAIPDNRLLG